MENCSNLWNCSTADGKLQAIATFSAILVSVILAIYGQRSSYKRQVKLSSEKSKKIFLDNEINFTKAISSIKVIFNSQEKKLSDINLLIRNVDFQINKIKESDLAALAHSSVSKMIYEFVSTGSYTVFLLKNIEHLLTKSCENQIEAFLLNESLKEEHELMNDYCDEVERNCEKMQEFLDEIQKFYK